MKFRLFGYYLIAILLSTIFINIFNYKIVNVNYLSIYKYHLMDITKITAR